MARAIWSGAISFGLVNIPVKLYSAVQRKTVRFNQLDGADNTRIQQKRVNPDTGEEVPYDRLVKGYEISPDRYVIIEPAELDSLQPEKTRTIDIQDFVDLHEIDPIYYDHPYYLAPGTGAEKAYKLLYTPWRPPRRWASPAWSSARRSSWWPSARARASWPWRPCCSPTRSCRPTTWPTCPRARRPRPPRRRSTWPSS